MDLSNTDYSSKQLITALDYMLYKALTPILNTSLVEDLVGVIVAWYSGPIGRRKISALEKDEFLSNAFEFLTTPSIDLYKNLMFDRNITLYIIGFYLDHTKEYRSSIHTAIKNNNSRTHYILKILKSKPNTDLYSDINECEFWYNLCQQYKKDLILKFYKYLKTRAKVKDHEDLVQRYIIAVDKAISKYDVSKGTLTSYVNFWLQDTNSKTWRTKEPRPEVFESYDDYIETIKKEDVQGESEQEKLEKLNEIDRVRLIAKAVDPEGIARIHLGISEILNDRERLLLNEEKV